MVIHRLVRYDATALLCRHRREVTVFELNQLAKTRFNANKLHVGLHMSRIYNWWLSSNTYTVSQLRIQEMDKAPKAVILRGGDSGEGSEIHPYSKFLDPSLLCPPRDQILAAPLKHLVSYLYKCLHVTNVLLLIIKTKYRNVQCWRFMLRTFTFCSSFYVILLGLCQLLQIPIIHIIDHMLNVYEKKTRLDLSW